MKIDDMQNSLNADLEPRMIDHIDAYTIPVLVEPADVRIAVM